MNALSPIPLPAAGGDAGYAEALAVLADGKIAEAVEFLAQWTEAHFSDPRRPRGQWEKVRDALVSLRHASDLLAPLTVERAQ